MAEQDDELERFRPTNGRLTGVLGLLLCAFVGVVLVVYEPAATAVPGVIGCAFAAVFIWVVMLRPSVAASSAELRLRTLFETVSIPIASVDTVVVRRYLLVRAGGRKYLCPAISRPLRKTVRTEMKWGGHQFLQPGVSEERLGGGDLQTEVAQHDLAYPDFVEQRIEQLAADDRARRGIEARSEEEYELGSQVVRRTARLELGVLTALAVAFVVALVVL
jgi:hypothetical protein